MPIDILLAERKRVAEELLICEKALERLMAALDVSHNQVERTKLKAAIENGDAEIKLLSERLLRIDVSISAAKSRSNR